MLNLHAINPVTTARPLISVVMPCYNAALYLEEAVGSALGQSYGNVEVVIVDDGSTDGSAEIAARLAAAHPDRILLDYTDRVGPFPARNQALKKIRGELVAFLDADDWWAPTALEKLYASLIASNADMAYCGWQNVGEGIVAEPYIPPAYEQEDAVAHFVRTCPLPIHGALIRRDLVTRLGGFSERRYSAMDYDFWLRALAETRRMVRVPEVLAFYRWHHQGQISAIKWRQVLDALAAQKDFIRANPHLVAHLPAKRLMEMTEGLVLVQAYRAFWKRDLISAHKLFRHAAIARAFALKDLRYILIAAMLPLSAYRFLIGMIDRKGTQA
ncbi:glycosyltransferase [Thiocystis violascens]|uniref:Glycosyl transferase n=1 Tax=Thiocystis violascens (strain ATCC 17096 / DSM 198 / 6111) TaxID=765911 RepID=I3YFV6_THIV6|nr:glycosyltransferase [Thiocystis violascens]AFL75874.1 glycosyl transferase [Thiocystis violascens DSM 198]